MYVGPSERYDEIFGQFQPNPFAEDFECTPNDVKGGIYITENILYGSICETDWSLEMAELIVSTKWICPKCDGAFNLTGVQKLQHNDVCNKIHSTDEADKDQQSANDLEPNKSQQSSNTKMFTCSNCKRELYLSAIETLKHKKSCH